MTPATRDDERRWMEQALALAALGEGTASPNPRVGCLLVNGGRVVGRGYHQAPGLPHAEIRALSEAGGRAPGSTLFINLEPCAHHGRTPPCCEQLLESGVRRVVAAVVDPNPLVNGMGFRRLREAGIAIEVGLLAEAARRLNAPFFHRHATGRPRVTLKAAVSLDGMLSAADGRSKWITGPAARRFAHRLRARHDAVLVGAETVRRDDPRLTVRLPGVVAPRRRVVLAPRLALNPEARIFRCREPGLPPPRVYVARDLPSSAEARFEDRAEIVRVAEADGRLDLGEVLTDLAGVGVLSVLVEGGGRTLAGFLGAGLADEAAWFIAPRLLGARGGTPMIDRRTVGLPGAGWLLDAPYRIPLADDLLVLGRLHAPR